MMRTRMREVERMVVSGGDIDFGEEGGNGSK